MKYLIALLLLISTQAFAWDQAVPKPLDQCIKQAPYGFPVAKTDGVVICRTAYVTLNDPIAKIPVWTSFLLEPDKVLGCVARTNAFVHDTSLSKKSRAETSDYLHSGYDMGHLANDSVMSWNVDVEHESFLLSNMAPQKDYLNRASWKMLESTITAWVSQRDHPFVIYTGPIYSSADQTIGINKVVVPHAFYKIAIDTSTNEVEGWLFPHLANLGNDMTKLRVPVAKISELTGIKFSYPTEYSELPATSGWAVPDFGKTIKAKQVLCKI